jgi:YidC/Oxa1 family membrane protein insertase
MLLLLIGVGASPVSAEEVTGERIRVTANQLDLVFSLQNASPVIWRACHPSCSSAQTTAGQATASSVGFTSEQDPPQARLELREAVPGLDLQRLRFTADLTEDARARIVTFQADLPVNGVRLVKSFAVSKEGYEVVLTVRLLGPKAAPFMAGRRLDLELGAGRGLFPSPAPGFAAMLDRVQRVLVSPGGILILGDEAGKPTPFRLGEWAGIRSRFWAILLQADGAGSLEPRPDEGLRLASAVEPEHLTWRYTFYSGPVEPRALNAADPELGRLFLSGLWFWLRALSFGLLYLLRGLTGILGNHGLSIIALAVCVKLLLLPLTKIAERLQEQVNATQARLQPAIDAINAAHRGEERARRTLALYREAGVHPFYTLRSLVGFLIQLPVFIAVFDMLAEDFDLQGVGFLWIRDLSRPDELWRLPACLPFFGCHLNLLPFLMSSISIAAVLRARSPNLTAALVRRQRRNLTGLALAFFLLFYTFPASMVLYWTSTNFVQLVGQELGRLTRRLKSTETAPPA